MVYPLDAAVALTVVPIGDVGHVADGRLYLTCVGVHKRVTGHAQNCRLLTSFSWDDMRGLSLCIAYILQHAAAAMCAYMASDP